MVLVNGDNGLYENLPMKNFTEFYSEAKKKSLEKFFFFFFKRFCSKHTLWLHAITFNIKTFIKICYRLHINVSKFFIADTLYTSVYLLSVLDRDVPIQTKKKVEISPTRAKSEKLL